MPGIGDPLLSSNGGHLKKKSGRELDGKVHDKMLTPASGSGAEEPAMRMRIGFPVSRTKNVAAQGLFVHITTIAIGTRAALADGEVVDGESPMRVKEVASRLEVSADTVTPLVSSGKLRCCRIGQARGVIRISEEQLVEYLRSAETHPAAEASPAGRSSS